MSEAQEILKEYIEAVRFPEASGFEVLELLDVRSRIATREKELSAAEQARLEEADATFLHNASAFYESVVALGDLRQLRRRAAAPCSHWWWYLEKLAPREPVKA